MPVSTKFPFKAGKVKPPDHKARKPENPKENNICQSIGFQLLKI
jgi:hypothetical protein